MLTRIRKKRRSGGFPLDMLLLLPVLIYCAHCAESPGPQPDDFSGTLDEAPQIEALSNYVGPAGSATTLIGSNFGDTAGDNTVYFAGIEAEVTGVTKGSDGEPDRIDTIVPATLPLGPARVTVVVNGRTSNAVTFQVAAAPMITGVDMPTDIIAVDVDNDQDQDLVVTCTPREERHYIAVLKNGGRGDFLSLERLPIYEGYDLESVSVSDLEHDGYPEVIAAISGSSQDTDLILVWPGGVDGFSDDPTEIFRAKYLRSMAVADFDNDGNDDLLIDSWGYARGGLLLGRGDATFREPIEAMLDMPLGTSVPEFTSKSVCDVNGDFFPDLVLEDFNPDGFSVFLGNGTASFSKVPAAELSTPFTPILKAADLDGDGKDDLCILNRGNWGESSALTVLSSFSLGAFQRVESYEIRGLPTDMFFHDLDGDGSLDVVICTTEDVANLLISGDEIAVLYNLGDGTLETPAFYPVTVDASVVRGTAADLTRDGYVDLVVAVCERDAVFLMSGMPGGHFQNAQSYPTSVGPSSLEASDLNGDGMPDLLAANMGYAVWGFSVGEKFAPGVSILYGDQDGSFHQLESRVFGNNPVCAVSGDLNMDGATDILVADLGAFSNFGDSWNTKDGGAYVLFGEAPGSFPDTPSKLCDTAVTSAALGDLNADGIPDVVLTAVADNLVLVLLGNGDGTFRKPIAYNTGQIPLQVEIADLNADGFLDLVVAGESEPHVTVHIGYGDGSFKSPAPYSAWAPLEVTEDPEQQHIYDFHSLAIGDINDDGIPDIVTASRGLCGVGILLGNGDGSFRRGLSPAETLCGRSVVIADLDRDGIMDLGVTCSTHGSVALLVGKGNGSFGKPAHYGAGSNQAIVASDLDQDGDLDLAVSGIERASVSVLWLEPQTPLQEVGQ